VVEPCPTGDQTVERLAAGGVLTLGLILGQDVDQCSVVMLMHEAQPKTKQTQISELTNWSCCSCC